MTLDEPIRQALRTDLTIDITTTGRVSGESRRIEIWFFNLDDRVFITGTPGARDWYANLVANPEFTFHLKESVTADIPAVAIPILDDDARRAVFEVLVPRFGFGDTNLERWIAASPLVEVMFS
ncbi:MAG: nitroreductase family deazaflavin-dependent oxidoreductase [Acidimicrobiia bacterium]|nr:nitroreductase family deazaflavin-dependent oxidoreductase [Acidimicrobiia bacterium]